jgi:IS30 family transposase
MGNDEKRMETAFVEGPSYLILIRSFRAITYWQITSLFAMHRWLGILNYGQGKEMSRHAQITENTGVKVYFADPHSP